MSPPQVNLGSGTADGAAAGGGTTTAMGGAIGAGAAAGGGGATGGGAASTGGGGGGGAAGGGVCAKARTGTTTAIASRQARSRINDPSQVVFFDLLSGNWGGTVAAAVV